MPDNMKLTFEKMNFFELQEDDQITVYCYEQDNYPKYLIASNESGEMPNLDQDIIVACYDSDSDVFLWKTEFADIDQLHSLYQQDSDNFIQLLEKKAL